MSKTRAGNTGKAFKFVRNAHPGRSVFDLSYTKLFTGDMGLLYPVAHDEMVPGDFFEVGAQAVIRMMPLIAPLLHEINVFCHYFFVPTRLLWDEWEDFITGGVTGNDTPSLPKWEMSEVGGNTYDLGTLWDYMGMPLINMSNTAYDPLDFIRRAYYMVYNQYYRDETQQAEIDITDTDVYKLKRRAWSKDYFTSALPWQQRGTAPALPVGGTAHAVFAGDVDITTATATSALSSATRLAFVQDNLQDSVVKAYPGDTEPDSYRLHANKTGDPTHAIRGLDDNSIDLSVASTFNIADFRLAVQLQRWMERKARGGVRYKEYLESVFGVSPKDERLQRAEYIGGMKGRVVISEVLQTSESATTPQGTMAGHGITVAEGFCGKYFATEYGYMIGIMSIMPVPMYSCQGINKQWLRDSNAEFYNPAFAFLSEQAIMQEEIFATNDAHNHDIFGYQGRFDEMRYKPNMVCNLMRPGVTGSLAQWHLARSFATSPGLNSDFIECNPDNSRIFAVPSQPGFLIHWANKIKAIRPMPVSSEPGLMDHSFGG